MKLIIGIALLALCQIAMSQDLKENAKDSEFGVVYFMRGKGNAGSARPLVH